MRTGRSAALLAGAAALSTWLAPAAARAQDARAQTSEELGRRIASAPDGTVRFRFAARDGVCGNGHDINIHEDESYRDRECEHGPVWVDLEKTGRGVTDLDLWVARTGESRDAPDTDLGEVSPLEATGYLLALAGRTDGDVGSDAIAASSLAADVVIWPDLLDIARADDLETDTREAAVFWLSQLAGEKATAGLEEIVRSEGDTEVKEAALFALSQLPDGAGFDALVTVVRENEDPDLVQVSLFWLGQSDDPRALALFEEILARE